MTRLLDGLAVLLGLLVWVMAALLVALLLGG